MNVNQINILGFPLLRIFGMTTDNYCIITSKASKYIRDILTEALEVPVTPAQILEGEYVGLFCVGNSNGIILPHIVEEKMPVDINQVTIRAKSTCLGNLILCNDKGALVSPLLSRFQKTIQDCLSVETEVGTIANIPIIGSAALATNQGILAHPEITEPELELVKDLLKVKVEVGTLNRGTPYVGICALANSKGAVVGISTTPPEVMRLEDALA